MSNLLRVSNKVKFGNFYCNFFFFCFLDGTDGTESACNAGDPGLIPGLARSPGEGNGNPLQYSCLENPMDRGAWRATVHRVAKSQTRLSNFTFFLSFTLMLKLVVVLQEGGPLPGPETGLLSDTRK